MAVFYIKSGAGAADYNAAHVYSTGDKMVPSVTDVTSNVAASRKFVWECTTGGTTNGAITWNAAPTQDVTTITQNGVVFTARKPGFSSGTTANWAYATIYLVSGYTAATSGDTVYVSNNHAESQSAAQSICAGAGVRYVCGDDSAAPPTAELATATYTSTGSVTTTINTAYTKGLNIISGSGQSGTASINEGGIFEKCSFQLATTGGSSVIASTGNAYLINCDVKFAAAGQSVSATGVVWSGGSLLAGGTSPTKLIGAGVAALIENIDLTNASAGINMYAAAFSQPLILRNIKLPSSWSGTLNNQAGAPYVNMTLANADNTGTDYQTRTLGFYGTLVMETTIVRTGGASDSVTPVSWKMVTSSSSTLFPMFFFQSPEIVKWNATTGSAITVTVDVVSSASLNNDELWLEVSYLGTSGGPVGTLVSSARAQLASAAAVTTSTATWTSSPGTPVYQKLQVTFTPQLKGYLHAVVKMCKASKTVYVDPVLQISGVTDAVAYQVPGGPYVNQVNTSAGGAPLSRVITGM